MPNQRCISNGVRMPSNGSAIFWREMIQLPEGVAEMLAVTGYDADYLPPRFANGARVKGTGGFQITDENGVCMLHVPLNADFETWRTALGAVLDYKRLPQPQEIPRGKE